MSITLQASPRTAVGSRPSRKLRLQGKIPASIQGEQKEHALVALDEREFLAARRQQEHLFDIEIDGGASETAIVQELQYDAMGDSILHVEFRRVVRGRPIEADVEIEFRGHPKGGILNHLMTQVTISAIPSKIPNSVEVVVDEVEEGGHVLAGEITMPEDVTLVTDGETVVATVTAARGIEETPAAEPEEGEAAEAPAAEAAPETPPAEGDDA
jgi:large subunit ribosomal protein L25